MQCQFKNVLNEVRPDSELENAITTLGECKIVFHQWPERVTWQLFWINSESYPAMVLILKSRWNHNIGDHIFSRNKSKKGVAQTMSVPHANQVLETSKQGESATLKDWNKK